MTKRIPKVNWEWVNGVNNSRKKRRRLFLFHSTDKDGNSACELCRREFHIDHVTGKKRTITLDHIIPLSRGGLDENDNYAIMCTDCNRKKGSLTIDDLWAIKDILEGREVTREQLESIIEAFLIERDFMDGKNKK